MVWMTLAVGAWAEPPGGGPPPNPASWVDVEGEPAIRVDGVAGSLVTVTLRARLGELTTSWVLLPQVPETESITLMLDVPPEAWLHPKSADFVTDLLAIVEVDGVQWLAKGFLAWPDGQNQAPVVWTAEQMRAAAPQGVLRAELRDPSMRDGDRLMPDVSDVVNRPATNVGLVPTEVEP